MYATKLTCRTCGTSFPLGNRYSCESCGGILEVRYDYPGAFATQPLTAHPHGVGIWRYSHLLPVKDAANQVSLGEGNTPLLEASRLARHWKADVELWIKAEAMNPTGSFKDRPTSVGVSVAKENGYQRIVVASSGNAAAAAGAYAARAGLECNIIVPQSTDLSKVTQAQSYGAKVYTVDGDFSDAYALALESATAFDWANVTSTYINPYTLEGDKTIAYELWEQLDGRVPDYILIPIGSGPLLTGVLKGYEELQAMGRISRLPAMVGVEAAGCAPITVAFDQQDDAVSAWMQPCQTVAGAIADSLVGYAGDGTVTLQSVRKTQGYMLSLTEEEILRSMKETEELVGLYSEPGGVVSVGAVEKLWNQHRLPKDSLVVSLLTGHGFKFSNREMNPPIHLSSHPLETLQGI